MAGLLIEVNVPLFIILALVALLIIIGNIFTICVIGKTQDLHNASGFLMVSLAVADLGVGFTTAMPLIYALFTDSLTKAACDSMGFLTSVAWVVSVSTLMLLSIDRYTAITRPLRYPQLITRCSCGAMIASTWLFSVVLWSLPLMGVGSYKFNDEEVACYFDVARHPVQWVIYMVVIFVPTSIVIIFSYVKIWIISRRQRRLMEQSTATTDKDHVTSKKKYKAVRTLFIIVGAFYLAWIPFIVEHLVKAALGKLEHVPEWLEIAIFVVAVSNSFWNPIIYLGTNREFRQKALLLFPGNCGKRNITPSSEAIDLSS